jgi:imidazole glycerol-phosphate synthase subunit HisH
MITIVDYGAGNLRSVENTLEALGAPFRITRQPTEITVASKLILPGVGHFGQMMGAIDALGLRAALVERARSGIPFLGICLGLQAMFTASEEAPGALGLGLYPGRIERFPAGARVPHMGWNEIVPQASSRLLQNIGGPPYVYFAHSYYAPPVSATAASCHYELDFTAVLENKNVFGVQFHPEKSGPLGLKIVRNFVEI